jgi:hypothetical protein
VNRVRVSDSGVFAAALDLLPIGLRHRLDSVDVVAGVDPVFVGVHGERNTGDGRSLRRTAHYTKSWGANDRRPTINYPEIRADERRYGLWYPVFVVVHELGHYLDELTGWQHPAEPVTAYAQTNRDEAFAEAFTVWAVPHLCRDLYGPDWYRREDGRTRRLFEELASS